MKCPNCGNDMENGYLQCMQRIAWVKKPHKVSLLPKQGEVLLENNMFKDCIFPASICKDCQKILVDYSNKGVEQRF